MAASIAARSNMWAAMSTASNAMETGIFTLFVPAIVGIGIPQAMVAREDALRLRMATAMI